MKWFRIVSFIFLIISLTFNGSSHANNSKTKQFEKVEQSIVRKDNLKVHDYDCKKSELDERAYEKAKFLKKKVKQFTGFAGNSAFLGFKGLVKGSAYIVVIIGRFLDFQTYGVTSVINILFYVAEILQGLFDLGLVTVKAGIDVTQSALKLIHIFERNHLEYFHLNHQCQEAKSQFENLLNGTLAPKVICDDEKLTKRIFNAVNFMNLSLLKKRESCGKKSLADYSLESQVALDPFLWAFLWGANNKVVPNGQVYKLNGPKKCQEIVSYGHRGYKSKREHYLYYLSYDSTPYKTSEECFAKIGRSFKNQLAKVNDVIGVSKIGKGRDFILKKKRQLKKHIIKSLVTLIKSLKEDIIQFAKSDGKNKTAEEKEFSKEVLENEDKLNNEDEILKAAEEVAGQTTDDIFTNDDYDLEKVKNYIGFFDKALSKNDVNDICKNYMEYLDCRENLASKIRDIESKSTSEIKKLGFYRR